MKELDQFVTARLVLILLPVREQLRSDGRLDVARVVEHCARDIGFNIAKLLERYDVQPKRER